MDEKQKMIEYNDYQRSREDIIQWITEQVEQMPLGLLKMVRGLIRGLLGL